MGETLSGGDGGRPPRDRRQRQRSAAFLNEDVAALLEAESVEVPPEAAREMPVYRGHRWWEPDQGQLAAAMREFAQDATFRKTMGERVSRHGASSFH